MWKEIFLRFFIKESYRWIFRKSENNPFIFKKWKLADCSILLYVGSEDNEFAFP